MKWWLAILALLALEVLSIAFVVNLAGPAITLVLLALAMALGVLVIRAGVRRLRQAARGSRSSSTQRAELADPITWTEPLVMIAAGIVLVVPGFAGDIVALAMLIPGVRLILLSFIGAWIARRFTSANGTLTRLRVVGGGPVVPGEANDPPQP